MFTAKMCGQPQAGFCDSKSDDSHPEDTGAAKPAFGFAKSDEKETEKSYTNKGSFFHLAVKNRSAFFLHCFSSVSRGNCYVETKQNRKKLH